MQARRARLVCHYEDCTCLIHAYTDIFHSLKCDGESFCDCEPDVDGKYLFSLPTSEPIPRSDERNPGPDDEFVGISVKCLSDEEARPDLRR